MGVEQRVSEEQVCKEIIEQVGYQEFYRYFQEKTTLIEQQRKEIKKLNNIINELEKYLKEQKEIWVNDVFDEVLNKLQELKGSNNDGQSFIKFVLSKS